ncbi:hypothetical protein CP533_5033 [Ophiocordyceps camponoti-saundersi (nom. inval.)]|nr:hypothetical protein CP533_5033 [Ophiocordyceps camponoti-saundersi (nom. inval.)]
MSPSTSDMGVIMVAVDFGTTYTSVAFANTLDPAISRHQILTEWGKGGNNRTNAKVPRQAFPFLWVSARQTVLRFENNDSSLPTYEWGEQALASAEEDGLVHEWFKLGICDNFKDRVCRNAGLERKYPSPMDRVGHGSEFRKKKLVTDFLSGVRESVDDYFRHNIRAASRLPKEYVITVPAIWDHQEQNKMRECAEKAGMGTGDKLQIVSEPEAAAIFAIEDMFRTGMEVGDTFIICDAGGGTVDLASCTIESKSPSFKSPNFELAMTQTNLGGLCGSSYLNRILRSYLKRKLEGYGRFAEDDESLSYVVQEFERRLKPEFSGNEDRVHKIRIAGLKESKRHGVFRNLLTFTTSELKREVFEEVMDRIKNMVRDQIRRTSGPIKAILLVGGFGNNPYLKETIEGMDIVQREKIDVNRINHRQVSRIFQDCDGRFNMTGTRVSSRIAGRHYGTKAYVKYKPEVHPLNRRKVSSLWELRHDGYKVEAMTWFAEKGVRIPDGESIPFKFEKTAPVGNHLDCYADVEICVCEEPTAPTYPDSSVIKIARMRLEFKGITIPKRRGDQGDFHVAEFEIDMKLESASLSFRGVYGRNTPDQKWFDPTVVEWWPMG